MQRMIEAQQRQIEIQKNEIGTLRRILTEKRKSSLPAAAIANAAPHPSEPAAADPLETLQMREEALAQQMREEKRSATTVSLSGGKPAMASPDGRFSAAVSVLGQYDTAYYMQKAVALRLASAEGRDLSSGSNFRRMQLGLGGKLAGDWSYFFNYDFGGTASEGVGRIQSAYIEYDGLAPFLFRIGAYAPASGLEAGTSAANLMFLERNSPSNIALNMAGGDGRDGIGITYAGSRIFATVNYTADHIQDTGVFDEQQALVGRLSGVVYPCEDSVAVLSSDGSYIFKVADAAPGANASASFSLGDMPELTVDNSGAKLITTGPMNARDVWQWGLESGVRWRSLYAQGGYFRFGMDLRNGGGSDGFGGWYAQAAWTITGEPRTYSPVSGAFVNPAPRQPFSPAMGGWGAWEIVGRYSEMDLNDKNGTAGSTPSAAAVLGGEQRIGTAGLNWYPVTTLRFEFQYQHVIIDRLGAFSASGYSQLGQRFDSLALRSQIAF